MENEKVKKVGAGILVIAIIEFIFQGFGVIGSIGGLLMKDKINSILQQSSAKITVTSSEYIISLIICSLLIVSVILILCKNTIGIFGYFILYVIDIAYSISKSGFSISILLSFILPILMAIFIYLKRDIFSLRRAEEE